MWNLGLLGASAISFSNLSSTYGSTYKHLQFRMSVKSTSTAGDDQLLITTGASNYYTHFLYSGGASEESGNVNSNILTFIASSASFFNNEYQGVVTDLLDFADTGKNKTFRTFTFRSNRVYLQSTLSASTAAINNLTFDCNSGNLVAGTYISIYGLKAGA